MLQNSPCLGALERGYTWTRVLMCTGGMGLLLLWRLFRTEEVLAHGDCIYIATGAV